MSSWNKEERGEARMGYLTEDQVTLIEIGDVVRIEAVDHDELTDHNLENDVGFSRIVSYGEVVEVDDLYIYLRPEYCALSGGSMLLSESVPENRIERLVKRCIYNVVKYKADVILQPENRTDDR